ncbi:unnamed protein product, partial [Laminaria digitata]
EEQQQQQQQQAAAVAREKRWRIRRLSYVILALLAVVVTYRWLGIATDGDDDIPAIASSRDELGAVLKLAGIKAKPRQVERAWSALRSGETTARTDLKP